MGEKQQDDPNDDPARAAVRRGQATLLFCDVVELSDRAMPYVDELVTRCTEIVERRGGTIIWRSKNGDCIACFGYPKMHIEHLLLALGAASDIMIAFPGAMTVGIDAENTKRLAEERTSKVLPPFILDLYEETDKNPYEDYIVGFRYTGSMHTDNPDFDAAVRDVATRAQDVAGRFHRPLSDVLKAVVAHVDPAVAATLERAVQEFTQHAEPPRLEQAAKETAAPARPAARFVTAEEFFSDVPLALQVKPRQRYKFPAELLDDPAAFQRAQSLVNARNYRARKGMKLAPPDEQKVRMANSFKQQVQRRREKTAQPG